jgi:3-oxoacyl-(acyl-carrier-protein) synthase
LGEAAAAVLVESAASAQRRGVRLVSTLLAHGAAFAGHPQAVPEALSSAIKRALTAAQCPASEVTLVSSGANGLPAVDVAHAQAAFQVFGREERPPTLCACLGNLGDCVDANGLLQLLTGVSALKGGIVPGILGLQTPRISGLRYATQTSEVGHGALVVTGISQTGSASALLRRTEI